MKTYRFYGWETADVQDRHGLTPRDYYDILSTVWCAETCAPRMRDKWHEDNKTMGQCSITAFLMQDLYGGKVYGIPRAGGHFHCFNVVDGCVFDLTSEQFGDEVLDYHNVAEQLRDIHLASEEKLQRYEYLSAKVHDVLRQRETPHRMSAAEAIDKLKDGNAQYLHAKTSAGDISLLRRINTCTNGQHPYAIILTCSDARVLPESVFSAGIGDLFVIRVAGNVMDDHQLGSIEYAAAHLGVKLIVVLGHNHCGAVEAALHHDPEGYIKFITDEIKEAIGEEQDAYQACCLNVQHSMAIIEHSFAIHQAEEAGLRVVGAMYHLEDGHVSFLP